MTFGPGDELPLRGRLVAVDLGEVRIGLATSDPRQVVASPAHTLQVPRDASVHERVELVAGWGGDRQVAGWVVGWPRDVSGREGAAGAAAREFAAALREAAGAPVALWDERFSTVEAERVMIAADASRAARRARIDTVAAGIVLQGVLDAQRRRRG